MDDDLSKQSSSIGWVGVVVLLGVTEYLWEMFLGWGA
jgi:hypothetical protein